MKKNTVAIMSFCFVAYSQTAINPIIHKLIIAYPGVSESAARLVSTVPAVSTFICAIIVGALVGRKMKYRTACSLSCIFWSIGGLMPIFLNQKFIFLLISRLIFGIGTGFAMCYNALIINTYAENKRAKMLGLAVLFVNAGSILTQILGGFLGEIQLHYTFYVYLLCPLELIFVLLFLKEPKLKTASENNSAEIFVRKSSRTKIIKYVVILLMASLSIWPISSLKRFS